MHRWRICRRKESCKKEPIKHRRPPQFTASRSGGAIRRRSISSAKNRSDCAGGNACLNSLSKNFHRPLGVALSRVVLVPTAAGDFGEADLAVIKVKWAEYQAMAVLFPEEARNEFFAL